MLSNITWGSYWYDFGLIFYFYFIIKVIDKCFYLIVFLPLNHSLIQNFPDSLIFSTLPLLFITYPILFSSWQLSLSGIVLCICLHVYSCPYAWDPY